MQRRAAIRRISFLGGGLILAWSGINVYQRYKRPHFSFLEDNKGLLNDLADTILPATDSPGAASAGVGDLIVTMARDCADRKTQNNFIDGLESLGDYTQRHYGKGFGQCTTAERTAILHHFEQEDALYPGKAGKVQQRVFGDPFFSTLKKYTVLGYCTSEAGATKGLKYDYIPGRYVGAVRLAPGQRGWATQ